MNIQTIETIPRITPEDLEKILKHLPEPTYAEVSLFGNFDYSDIFRQAEEVVQSARLQSGGHLTFRLKDASKEKILDIYRKSQELEGVKPTIPIPKRINLHKVGWYLDDHVQVELIPEEVNVKYKGQEPKYISEMVQELSGINVRMVIEINN